MSLPHTNVDVLMRMVKESEDLKDSCEKISSVVKPSIRIRTEAYNSETPYEVINKLLR